MSGGFPRWLISVAVSEPPAVTALLSASPRRSVLGFPSSGSPCGVHRCLQVFYRADELTLCYHTVTLLSPGIALGLQSVLSAVGRAARLPSTFCLQGIPSPVLSPSVLRCPRAEVSLLKVAWSWFLGFFFLFNPFSNSVSFDWRI